MKEFQSQVISAKTNLLLMCSIILIIAIDHLCSENSVIMTLLWHFFKSSLNNHQKNPDKTQSDLPKVTTKGKLLCQEKQLFFGSKKNIKLSSIFKKNKEPYINEKETQDLEHLNFIVNAIRSMLLDEAECLPTWAACRSLTSKVQTPLMHVGFLPYLPYPVTEYSTVCTTLCNFLKIQTQLN